MLTGLFPPTEGDASVYGLSLVGDMERVREIIGVCPQDNVLFPELTVEEHLALYGGACAAARMRAPEAEGGALSRRLRSALAECGGDGREIRQPLTTNPRHPGIVQASRASQALCSQPA